MEQIQLIQNGGFKVVDGSSLLWEEKLMEFELRQ